MISETAVITFSEQPLRGGSKIIISMSCPLNFLIWSSTLPAIKLQESMLFFFALARASKTA